ncbi:uncharacterized protein MELLADRAFT_104081 [Melampsora larici-populina 98AG31]|uniref:Uncharacterized protein n=1 Tax=Melampsora larici-populina (strain 98AG31 / pathotype 3-4-7) TaxID=747676 RepID=F4RDH7_MELLP|nr:uncharacterized protein MELLADRAFT_104081 [Melampsora larici-populina 98AG31]EGG09608.1 hypothetical protein MELLADRAFT_104081 [Melampsora larici-populina 98AG31]
MVALAQRQLVALAQRQLVISVSSRLGGWRAKLSIGLEDGDGWLGGEDRAVLSFQLLHFLEFSKCASLLVPNNYSFARVKNDYPIQYDLAEDLLLPSKTLAVPPPPGLRPNASSQQSGHTSLHDDDMPGYWQSPYMFQPPVAPKPPYHFSLSHPGYMLPPSMPPPPSNSHLIHLQAFHFDTASNPNPYTEPSTTALILPSVTLTDTPDEFDAAEYEVLGEVQATQGANWPTIGWLSFTIVHFMMILFFSLFICFVCLLD